MKIEYLHTVERVKYKEIRPGDIFCDADENICFCIDEKAENHLTYVYADLRTGRTGFHGPDEIVKRMNKAKLTVDCWTD